MQFYALKRKKGIWYNLIILGILCQQKIEGEKYEKLYLTANEIQKVQDSVISFQSYHIAIRDSLLVVSFGGLDSLNSKLIDYQERYLAERKKKRRNGWIAAGSIALNAVLIFVSSR